MATAGSGDILTGLIAGLTAQFPARVNDAVIAAAWLHGKSGELAAADLGEMPVVVARDETGAIAAFENRCAHRGAMICLDDGGKGAKEKVVGKMLAADVINPEDGEILASEAAIVGPQSPSRIVALYLLDSRLDDATLAELAPLDFAEKRRRLAALDRPVELSPEARATLAEATERACAVDSTFDLLATLVDTFRAGAITQCATDRAPLGSAAQNT